MRKLFRVLLTALLAALALTVPQAAQAAPNPTYDACPDFKVSLSSTGGTQSTKITQFDGGNIYTIVNGKGTTITVTNVETGESVTFGTKGSVTKYSVDPETGDITWHLAGANLVLLFDRVDVGGPSTILYTGLITFTSDSKGTLTEGFDQVSGTQRDICAELS